MTFDNGILTLPTLSVSRTATVTEGGTFGTFSSIKSKSATGEDITTVNLSKATTIESLTVTNRASVKTLAVSSTSEMADKITASKGLTIGTSDAIKIGLDSTHKDIVVTGDVNTATFTSKGDTIIGHPVVSPTTDAVRSTITLNGNVTAAVDGTILIAAALKSKTDLEVSNV